MKLRDKLFLSTVALVLSCTTLSATNYHVSPSGSDTNAGTQKAPFATISKAAYVALAADTVFIHEGTYREWVSPVNGGISPARRITYMAVPGDEVHLKGSEVVEGWKEVSRGVWSCSVDNTLFGDFNPFALKVQGDWLQKGKQFHLGSVYIAGEELVEAETMEELSKLDSSWIAKVDDKQTVITANFGEANPNKQLTEINVRPTCFFPKTTGVNYITVDGINISQAATQWSAPTSEQIGIIGPNWSFGWVIENCEVSQSKCVGVCLGKERASGHNMWSLYRGKFGYTKCGFNREIEAILKAYDLGWNSSNIGSHIVRNNRIHDCGQSGIVGHLGAINSVISHNEIYNINRTNGRMTGAETAGIKIHAAIDARFEDNCITNCVMGMWLDWQAQGTHVVGNIFADNEQQDLFIEVSHGPTLVYNNIMLSNLSLRIVAQGITFANNLIAGGVRAGASPERYTPYHQPHSTKVKGLFNNTGGDVRFYNNIFIPMGDGKLGANGLSGYNRFPLYSDDFCKVGGTGEYLKVLFPIWMGGNIYYDSAKPHNLEQEPVKFENKNCYAKLIKKDGAYHLEHNINIADLQENRGLKVDTEMLGQTFISEAIFENPDTTPFILNQDIHGNKRNTNAPIAGPFEKDNQNIIWKL